MRVVFIHCSGLQSTVLEFPPCGFGYYFQSGRYSVIRTDKEDDEEEIAICSVVLNAHHTDSSVSSTEQTGHGRQVVTVAIGPGGR